MEHKPVSFWVCATFRETESGSLKLVNRLAKPLEQEVTPILILILKNEVEFDGVAQAAELLTATNIISSTEFDSSRIYALSTSGPRVGDTFSAHDDGFENPLKYSITATDGDDAIVRAFSVVRARQS